MKCFINQQEREALRGLTDFQVRVYIFGIRWFMDFATAIAGTKRKISYQSIAEETYVDNVPGVPSVGSRSKWQIVRALKALEKRGLIAIKSTDRQLIFECLLANKQKFVQNQAATRPQQEPAIQAACPQPAETPVNTNNFTPSINQAATEDTSPTNAQAATPQYIYKYINNTTVPYLTRARSLEQNEVIHSPTEMQQAFPSLPPILPSCVSDSSTQNTPVANPTAATVGDWEVVLVNERGFQIHQVKRPEVIQMLVAWCKHQVTREEALRAMDRADSKLGKRPDTPKFYRNFVEEEVHARKQTYDISTTPQGARDERRSLRNPRLKTKADLEWHAILSSLGMLGDQHDVSPENTTPDQQD